MISESAGMDSFGKYLLTNYHSLASCPCSGLNKYKERLLWAFNINNFDMLPGCLEIHREHSRETEERHKRIWGFEKTSGKKGNVLSVWRRNREEGGQHGKMLNDGKQHWISPCCWGMKRQEQRRRKGRLAENLNCPFKELLPWELLRLHNSILHKSGDYPGHQGGGRGVGT